ncbi:MAG: His/Gly/Thr/Pro-type tRNA ligase C-terminal domain-containing protein [bacterium]
MKKNDFKEEEFNSLLRSFLKNGEIVDDSYPIKGASTWYPYGFAIMENILKKAKAMLEKENFNEIILPSFINGEEFLKECNIIKDFSERVYWSPVFRKSDHHVVKPTIEAQICSLLSEKHKEISLPLHIYSIREIGRYETGKTFPIWKERSVWPFFELFSAHKKKEELKSIIELEINFMRNFFKAISIPVFIAARPKISKKLQEYSEKRIEAVSITPYNRVVVLANIYDLGNIFSKTYKLKQKNGSYLQMSTLGFSGRTLISAISFLANRKGLLVPPSITPFIGEIILVQNKKKVINYAQVIKERLGIDFYWEEKTTGTFGIRKRKAITKGVPLLIIIGEKEIKKRTIYVESRLLSRPKEISMNNLDKEMNALIKEISINYNRLANFRLNSQMVNSQKSGQLKKMLKSDYLVTVPTCQNKKCLTSLELDTGTEIIGVPLDKKILVGNKCIVCNKKAHQNIIMGKKWKGEK